MMEALLHSSSHGVVKRYCSTSVSGYNPISVLGLYQTFLKMDDGFTTINASREVYRFKFSDNIPFSVWKDIAVKIYSSNFTIYIAPNGTHIHYYSHNSQAVYCILLEYGTNGIRFDGADCLKMAFMETTK